MATRLKKIVHKTHIYINIYIYKTTKNKQMLNHKHSFVYNTMGKNSTEITTFSYKNIHDSRKIGGNVCRQFVLKTGSQIDIHSWIFLFYLYF